MCNFMVNTVDESFLSFWGELVVIPFALFIILHTNFEVSFQCVHKLGVLITIQIYLYSVLDSSKVYSVLERDSLCDC